MANSLELQVSLGLQEAQKQIQSLRETLLKSVQMDSTAFKTTNDFLEKLKNRADELKGKMESAFKTSSDSKKYLKDYENLLTNLKTATEKFSTFNLDDFILTDTEKKQIDELRDKIKQLQQDLTNLRKGTIGNFFDDSTVQNADKVKHAAEKLGLSIENLTFSGLSSTFEKEMSKVDKLIEKSEEKLQSLQGQLNTLSTNKVSTIRDDIQKAFDAATTGKSFKTDTTDYQELLKNFYSGFENYSGQKTNNIKAGSNVQDFINSEVDAIIKGCEQMRQRIPEYQKLQQEILNAYKTAPSANASKEAIQNVLKQYNVEDLFKDIDISQNYAKYFGAIKARFKTLFVDTGLMDESTINQLQTNMVAGIQHIFDNADLTTNINTSAFKSQVSNILKNSGLNLNSQEIGAITNAIVKGFDLSALLDNTDKVMEQYRDRVQSEADTTKQTLDDLNEKKKELNEADNTVNSDEVNNKRAENYQKTQEAASGAAKALHDVAEAHQQEAAAAAGNAGSNEDAIRVHEQAVAAIRGHIDSLTNLERKQKSLSNIQMAVDRWMGFWQVLNLTKTAINDMKKHIQELDTVMTSIAVVTNMSQDDLWGQISRYSEIARQYGVAIKGVYEVSQIYYQQGLQSNDVMTLTTETLKMARIAGLDYATAADYMTTAIRGFKLEMQDAGHVTDVFSALAATTASSTEELAVAISKTAASAEAVGSSFEATTAMMATMIATTRESATNIGTALKSVISRYGEMTADPTALRDSEGEEMSLNRVDAALQTVGITIHDTAGQFRDFDDVLLELMEKWDSLDSLSQRYIATLMAGNRQQSRFLALVSNVDEYRKALQTANDAAGTGDLQTLKTLDSIDAKIERMKVTIQEFYTSSGIQDLYKNILDTITNVVSAGNSLPKVFGKIPGLAIAVAGSLISIVKSAATIILNHISNGLSSVSDNFANMISKMVIVAQDGGAQAGKQFSIQFNNATQTMGSTLKNTLTGSIRSVLSTIGSGLSLIGGGITLQGLSKYGSSTNADEDRSAGTTTRNGALLSIVGKTISGIAMGGAGGAAVSGGILTVPAAIIGGITGLTSGLVENFATLTSAHEMLNVSISRQIELADKAASQAQEEVIRAKGEEKALSQAYNQLKELEAARYDSIEAEQAYKDQMNQLRDSYPSLVESIDQAGNAIITTKTLEEQLAAARQKTSTATIGSIEAELKKLETQKEAYNRLFDLGFSEDYNNSQNVIHGWLQDHYQGYDSTESHAGYDYNLLKWYGEQTGRDFTSVLNSGDSKLWQKAIFTNYIDIYQKLAQSMTSSLDEFGGYDNFIATNLSYYLNEIAKATNISLDELTEIENFDTNLLFDLKGEKLIELIKVIQQHASEHINSITETYENIDNTLQYEKTKKDVNSYLDQLKNSPDIIEQQLYNQIKDYSSFISFVFDSKFGSYIDMNAGDNTKYRNEIATWVSQHQSLASSLMQADYNSYRSMIDFYKDFEGVKGSVVDAGWKEQFEKLRKEATDGLSQQLNNIFGINSELFKNLFNDKIEEKDGELTTQNISYLRAGLTHYQDLIKDGQHAAASAYLNSLNQVFNQIGALDSFKQTQIAPIISSLDFTNSESLTKAAEQLQSMGGFDDLVNELNDAATRLMYNVGAMTQRLQASLQETIENVEKAAENAGKGVKYSEAYKNAADILTKYDGTEELVFDDIYQYNEAVGGYLLTRRGLELQLSQQSADVAKEIEDAKTQASTMYNFLDSSYFNQKYVTNFADEDWRKSQVSSFKTTFGISESEAEAYLTQMQEIYEGYDGSIDWDIYIQEQKDNYEKLMQVNEDMYQSLVKNSIGISIVSLDYTKIANGEGNYLKDTLAAQLKQIGLNINNYWADLLEGDVSSLNQALSEAGIDAQVSLAAQKASIQANAEQYHTALKELLDPSITSLSETTTALLEEQGYTQTDLKDPEIFNEVINNLRAHIGSMIDGVLFTLEDYNKIIADSITTNLGGGKEKAVIDMVQGGFTVSELESYANQYKLELSDFFDETTNTFTNSALAAIYHYNPETDTFEANANASAEEIIAALAKAFNVKLADFTDFAIETIDSQIVQRAKDNKGKQIASQLQNLSSAKVGDEINVSSLTSEMQAAIGAADGIVTISSEYQRDNLLLLLETYINNYKDAGKEALQAVYRTINDSIISSRGTKGANLENIIQSSINLDDYRKALATEFGENGLLDKDIVSDEAIKQRAINRGYIYDEYSKQLIATQEALSDIDAEIAKAEAPDSGATEQTIRTLKQKREALVTELNRNYENEALIGVLSSYENISEQALNDFRAEFGNNYDEYFDTDALGNTFIKDFEGLKAAMANYGEIFDEYIATIADSYIDNISKAGSLATSGTTSQVEIQGFQQAFGQLFNGKQANFVYDSIINAWVLDINDMIRMIQESANKLEFVSETEKQTYIQNQIDALFKDNLDFSQFLSGTATTKESNTLKSNLQKYFITKAKDYGILGTKEGLNKWAQEQVDSALETLSKGGSDAIEELKRIKPEATAEELQAAYEAQIAPIKAAAELVDSLEVGSFVATENIEALTEAGFTIESNVVVKTAENLVDAYKSLYNQMAATGEATISSLNTLYATMLDAADQQNIDAIEVLQNATGLTYSSLGEILSRQNIKLEDVMSNQQQYGIQTTNFGKIIVANWTAFAKEVFGADDIDAIRNNPEYLSAFKTYNDSLIELNKTIEDDIADEISQLSSAKRGDWLNLTNLYVAFERAIQKTIDETDFSEFNSNIPNLGRRAIVSSETMQKAFGDNFAWDDYGTIYGKTFTAKQLNAQVSSNVGMSFAQIDENGIPVKDIDAYANELIQKSINLFGKVTAATIKYIDSTERNLLIDINDFANDLEDAEVWNKQDTRSILAHEREAETSYGRSLYARLHLFGASFENGILKISEEANLLGVAETISEIAHSTGIDLGADLAEIEDTIHSILQSYTDAIVKGISGGLTNAEALDLQEKAFDMGLGELSFDETAEGLKLAQNSAIELYDRLKLIDGLQGRLVFDALNKSLQESNEHYQNISDIANRIAWIEDESHPERAEQYRQELELAKEIYAVRSTSEDSSFNFMSNAIPSGQNNPINYYKNWASAIRTFNDALKNKGSYTKDGKTYKSGFVDYDYWYNLVTEMNNIAALGGNIEFAGETLDGSLEAASKLIQKGAASLVATNTGDIKVALSGMSLDFEAGANNFSSGVTDGIQAMAKSQIEMLDGMIQLLETVVAMEKLGDITGENDTIDISDLFPSIDWKDGKNHIIENEQAINWINNEVLTADADSELGKFIDNALLNNRTVRDTLKAAVTESEGINEETAAALSSLLNSLWQMYISNDYNLNDPYNSLQQIANASNLDMVIPMGDAKVIIERGAMIVEEKDKNGEAVWKDVQGNTYKDQDEAFAAAMMSAQGIDTKAKDYKYNAGTKTATGTLTIDNNTVTVTRLSNGSMSFVDTEGNTGTTLNEYIETIIAKQPEEVQAQKRIQLQLQTGAITLDSVSYRAINEKLRQELETAFSNGDTITINRIIEEHAEFKSLKGKTAEEQAKILGLELKTQIINIEANTINATGPIEELQEALDKLQDKTITITTVEKTISDAEKRRKDALERNYVYDGDFATGNLGLAKAKGTLMGELGPELVVSQGHYYVVGQNGPEMVDLAEDAIVFNHLQTKSLLEKGTSTGRGKAVTNERTAIAFASGSIHGGPAMASATALLATLKELRTQWQALAGLSAKDLAGAGGSGGGGGGGGNSDTTKAFIKDLEKWYNWLQEIDKLEEHINYQETLRSKIQSDMVAHGQDYFQSQLVSLDNLQKEVAVQKDLYKSQEEYFNKRKNYFNSTDNPFSSLYEFDEQGQLKYKAGKLEQLSYMSGTDQYGAPNMTAKEQYDYIVNTLGIDTSYLKYDDEGNEIKQYDDDGKENSDYYTNIVQAFWDKIDADKEEMQSLHDSVEEHKKAVLEKQQAMNEIMKDVEDNQIAVENKVYDALVDSRERAIEELEKTKDAIEESANKLIDGLQKQLDNERDMYEAQNNKDELIKLQRQLSILQRSGASTSEMASLQAQITQKQQDNYFEEQQRQIDAIQEASNNELEKLQQQIDLETEMLAYEKENGLLWSQVYDIMHGNNAEGIAAYIKENNSSMWGKSPTEQMKLDRENLFKTQYYKEYEKIEGGLQALVNHFTDTEAGIEDNPEKAEAFTNEINGGSKSNNSSGSETKGTANGTVSNTGGTWKSDDTGWWYQYNGGSWATGWKNIDGKDYYFNDKGYMQTGWVQGSDGKWYYLGADGAMVTGTQSIDGKTWNFDENGVWDGKDGVAESTSSGSDTKYKATYTVYDSAGNTTSLGGYGVGDTPEAAKSAAKALGEEKIAKRKNYSYVVHDAQAYEQGGLNKYTGVSILHGTETDPEAVLNASQTHILRDEILSNKPNSLLSLLSAWRDSVIGLADTSNINTNYDNGITIEKAEVIMQVQQIANDYDAQRAGEQALDKIMGIARKTIAQNRIGR